MFRHTDSLFPILLQTLSDESDEVGPPVPAFILESHGSLHSLDMLDWLVVCS